MLINVYGKKKNKTNDDRVVCVLFYFYIKKWLYRCYKSSIVIVIVFKFRFYLDLRIEVDLVWMVMVYKYHTSCIGHKLNPVDFSGR